MRLIFTLLLLSIAATLTPAQMNPTQANYGTQELAFLAWNTGVVYLGNDLSPVPGHVGNHTPGTPAGSFDILIIGLEQNPAPMSATLLGGPDLPIWIDPLGSVFIVAPHWIVPQWSAVGPGSGKVWRFIWLGGPVVGGTFGLTVHFQMLRVTQGYLDGYSNMLSLTL